MVHSRRCDAVGNRERERERTGLGEGHRHNSTDQGKCRVCSQRRTHARERGGTAAAPVLGEAQGVPVKRAQTGKRRGKENRKERKKVEDEERVTKRALLRDRRRRRVDGVSLYIHSVVCS